MPALLCPDKMWRFSILLQGCLALRDLYAQHTTHLTIVIELLGFAVTSEPGARVLSTLIMETRPDTLLPVIRHAALPGCETPRVLGVDNFAFRGSKGCRMMLLDLEWRCRVDLLPDWAAETVRQCLGKHTQG